MRYGAEARAAITEHINCPTPFVAFLTRTAVENIVEVRVFDMELIWIDSNYWSCLISTQSNVKGGYRHTVLFVQLVDFEDILAPTNNIMVEFIP
jgi:hypothetical protein